MVPACRLALAGPKAVEEAMVRLQRECAFVVESLMERQRQLQLSL